MVDIAMLDPERAAQIMGYKTDSKEYLEQAYPLPSYVRVQVQLKDKTTLGDCANILEDLSREIRNLSRRHELSQYECLRLVHDQVKAANYKMLSRTKSGRVE